MDKDVTLSIEECELIEHGLRRQIAALRDYASKTTQRGNKAAYLVDIRRAEKLHLRFMNYCQG